MGLFDWTLYPVVIKKSLV